MADYSFIDPLLDHICKLLADGPSLDNSLAMVNEALIKFGAVKATLCAQREGGLTSNEHRFAVSAGTDVENRSKSIREQRMEAPLRDYCILYFLDKSTKKVLSKKEILSALERCGIEIKASSLQTKLSRWKDPHNYGSTKEVTMPLVTWESPRKIMITDEGRKRCLQLETIIEDSERQKIIDLVLK